MLLKDEMRGFGIIFCAIALFAVGCFNPARARFERDLRLEIANALRTNAPTYQLGYQTPFTWDKVFVFHPYMPPEKIEAQLGFRWNNSVKDDLGSNDGFNLIVFVRENKVVQYARVPCNLVDWEIGESNGFKQRESIFMIEKTKLREPVLRITK